MRIDHLLRLGADNEIRVSCRTHLDSRWYAGAGIHRDVHLLVKNPHHIAVDGVRIATTDIDAERAIAGIAVRVSNASGTTETLRAEVRVLSPAGEQVVTDSQPITLWPGEEGTAHFRLPLPHPRLWSADSPDLYTAIATVVEHETVVDEASTSFGVRTLQVDAARGLRVNGQAVKLRGACLHADNGPLGAAAIGRAEERKVELLKAAGFNAIRSSHHPASSALLAACDRIGMYVIDEAFDMWTSAKTDFDYSTAFPEWWERDLDALVVKDVNHPSVIAYSIGNEIPETGSPDGGRWSRLLAGRLRSLDPHRLVTNGINGFVSVLDAVLAGLQQRRQQPTGGVNQMMADHQLMMDQIHASSMVTERTEESFAALDIAGLNYGEARYQLDHDLFPNRVIVGLETYPGVIARNWAQVLASPHLIGDFTWTGWDYLGETGLGLVQYPDDPSRPVKGFSAAFPGLTAWCGDFDITGRRRPMSYYREIVFGLREQPYLAVQRPPRHDQVAIAPPWAWSDTVASWTWPGAEGGVTTVEVYADADEVELRLNGATLARKKVGDHLAFRVEFEVTYQPGELSAIAYRNGVETGRATLHTARAGSRLRLSCDRPELAADTHDLAFVEVALVDADGRLCTSEDREIAVLVEGAGVLAGFGSANPVNPARMPPLAPCPRGSIWRWWRTRPPSRSCPARSPTAWSTRVFWIRPSGGCSPPSSGWASSTIHMSTRRPHRSFSAIRVIVGWLAERRNAPACC